MAKLYITVLVLYTLFVAIYFVRARTLKRRKKNIVGDGSSILENEVKKVDIIGKSKFDLSHSQPEATTSLKIEKGIEKPDIFALSNNVKGSAEVPEDELDEAFTDTPEEENEPMDIDCPLKFEDEEDELPEEEETEEVIGTAQAAFASGVKFEDLGNAVRTVNRKDEATPQEREAAGNTLLEIRQTDMFEQLVSGKSEKRETVSQFIAEGLAAFHRRKDKESGKGGNGKKVPDSFDIRDFA